MTKIFLAGASGNVGRSIVRALSGRDDFELAGGWCLEAGEDLGSLAGIGEIGIKASADLENAIAETKPDIVVDFSCAAVLKGNMEIYLRLGADAIIGATGLTEDELAPVCAAVRDKGLRWTIIPNFALGMNLVSEFVKRARKFYPFVTISDQHTNEMANAPSGTAAKLARELSDGPAGEVKSREVYPGVLGADIDGIPVTSQRLPWPGPYSGHTITLARKDEIIKISVEDFTSDVYLDGIFMTAARLRNIAPGTVVRSLSDFIEW